MTKQKAIKQYCFECGGSERANVMLCHLTDCPLWPFRFGAAAGSATYAARMKAAWDHYTEVREELEAMGISLSEMLGGADSAKCRPSRRGYAAKKGGKTGKGDPRER